MVRKTKILFAVLFSLMLVVLFAEAAWAEGDEGNGAPDKEVLMSLSVKDGDGTGVHQDPATFQKNYCLTADQKT